MKTTGLSVCEEWRDDVVAFKSWAENNGYQENLCLTRKDRTRGYSPDNCEYITIKEKSKRSCGEIIYQGKTISELCEERGLKPSTIWMRLKSGWPIEKALSTPVRELKKQPQSPFNEVKKEKS